MPSSIAERVRIHRKRRRNGLRSVRVLIAETEIDDLVRGGYLKQENRHLTGAVRTAVNDFICHRLAPLEDE